jgi:hypothetical protein
VEYQAMSAERIITNAMLRAQDQERIALLEGLLREISGWDMMDVAADGKYWRERIRAALGE